MRRRAQGSVYKRPDSPNAYITYSVNGRKVKENTHQRSMKVARALLVQRLDSIAKSKALPHDVAGTRVSELIELVRNDYRINGQRSGDAVERRTRLHLMPFFMLTQDASGRFTGGMRCVDITDDSINNYILARQQANASNASINRELAILQHGYKLGMMAKPRRVLDAPNFPNLDESHNVRRGFLEAADRDRVATACAKTAGLWLRAIFELAVTYGWRRAELVNLRCGQVDLGARTVSLDPTQTKNKSARIVVLTDNAFALVQQFMAGKNSGDLVFTTNKGRSVASRFQRSWSEATAAAGVRLLFHDLRRTAVRNMVRAGIPERVCMTISGHKTREVFERYNIVNDADLRAAAVKLNQPVPAGLGPVSVPVTPATVN